ncbi:unnamed protein product [Rhizophagus irregularis]|nr:unnamed protein product [Rhizophagus irregularis]
MSWLRNIRVVVGLDFGTTYSGFTYCHVENSKDIRTNDKWPGEVNLKTNTVLQYDSNFRNVVAWGNAALSKRPNQRIRNETRPVELFKLYLGKLNKELRPRLPAELGSDGYKKAITDYLRELGVRIKEMVEKWEGVDFTENVLFVLTVPAEYSEIDQDIMRRCAHKANLIKDKDSPRLQFTTEPEAAAIYCMESKLKEYNLLKAGTTFMIVDCGGGTVDLTTRKWNSQKHPPSRKVFDDKTYLFETFVKRGVEVEVDKEFPKSGYKPLNSSQKALKFELYKTTKHNATYHDEDGMELVGTLRILLPNGFNHSITFGFSFGQMEITAFAKNETNGQNFHTKFDVNEP